MEDVLERWRSEKTSSFLSDAVAANEPDPKRAKLFGKMAKAAEAQAAIIANDLKQVPEFTQSADVDHGLPLGYSAASRHAQRSVGT